MKTHSIAARARLLTLVRGLGAGLVGGLGTGFLVGFGAEPHFFD